MPRHIDRIVPGNIGIYRLFKFSGDCLRPDITERTRPYVTDKSVGSANQHPVILIFEHRYIVAFPNLGQDRTLDTSAITHLGIAFYLRRLHLTPFRSDHSPRRRWRIVHLIFHIRILLDERECNICGSALRFQDRIIRALLLCYICILIASDFNRDISVRQCIQQDIFIGIPVKPFVDLISHNRVLNIVLPVINFSGHRRCLCLFRGRIFVFPDHFIVDHYSELVLCSDIIILFQIGLLI